GAPHAVPAAAPDPGRLAAPRPRRRPPGGGPGDAPYAYTVGRSRTEGGTRRAMTEVRAAPTRPERRIPPGRSAALGGPAGARRAGPGGERAGVAATAQPLVRVHGLAYTYPDGTALNYGEGALEVLPGERVVILGPNGAGKSTLLLHVLGLLKAQLGEVRV